MSAVYDDPPTPATAVLEIGKGESSSEKRFNFRKVPRWVKWVAAFITLVTGVLSTIAFKVMNLEEIPPCDGCDPVFFTGALIQVISMMIGEALCLPIYLLDKRLSHKGGVYPFFDFINSHKELEGKKGKIWWWFTPPILDTCATAMMAIAMQITYASTVQMLRNFMVCIAAVLQLVLIRKALKVHEYAGIILITLALALSAIPALDESTAEQKTADPGKGAVGIILALVGTSVQAFQLIFEEFLCRRGRISAGKAVGLEGCAGIVYGVILMPIFNASGLEAVWDSWYQFAHSGLVIGWTVGYVFVALLFNIFGLTTTKLGGGLLRGIIFALRAPIVWIIEVIAHWNEYDHYNLASMLVFLLGFSFYCRMYPLPGKANDIWKKPIHYCCTKPELDDDYVPPTTDNSDPKETTDESDLKETTSV